MEFRPLPERNQLAVTSNAHVELTAEQIAFVTGGERDYATLPEILETKEKNPITDIASWEKRRKELLDIFRTEIYGPIPMDGFTSSFEVLEEGDAFSGSAIRRQINIKVTTGKGSSDALMLLYIPKNAEGKVPVILGANFRGNVASSTDPEVLPSYVKEQTAFDGVKVFQTPTGAIGEESSRWCMDEILAKGVAIATIFADDIAPDNREAYVNRVIRLFDIEDFKNISAWAFGLLRGVDYLVNAPELDPEKIAISGHSRMGKAALWAAANDTRIKYIFANDSGHAGASISRDSRGETVSALNDLFPHWMSDNYKKYNSAENDLPVDQHQLLAIMAPRPLYLANAKSDLWADPQGTWNALMLAQKVYALYGCDTIPEQAEQPESYDQKMTKDLGYHLRDGWHDITLEDWEFFLKFLLQ